MNKGNRRRVANVVNNIYISSSSAIALKERFSLALTILTTNNRVDRKYGTKSIRLNKISKLINGLKAIAPVQWND